MPNIRDFGNGENIVPLHSGNEKDGLSPCPPP